MSDVTQISDYRQKRKQMDVSAEMLEQIQFVADSDVTADDIVVFEATAVNTLPLNKDGSIFHEGRLTRATLSQMAERLNSKDESVPLHTMHLQGDELPVGRVFHAYVNDLPDGQSELRAQFYLSRTESSMIEKINLGILDEVSIGLKSTQLLCSKCGFDYFGDEADFEHLWDRTCNNSHTIGSEGTHVILSGLDSWMELSLVSRGAASRAKIHGRAQKVMKPEQQDRIAASGFTPDAVTLFASPSYQKEETPMTDKPEVNKTPAASEAEFDAQAALTELSGKIDALVEALAASVDEPKEPVVTAEDADKEEIAALKASVAALEENIATLSKPKVSDLAKDLPVNGAAADAITDADKGAFKANFSAFKTRK